MHLYYYIFNNDIVGFVNHDVCKDLIVYYIGDQYIVINCRCSIKSETFIRFLLDRGHTNID